MKTYDRFAKIYAEGRYPNLSQAMAEIFPTVMQQYKIPSNGSKRLLDIACGEGSFAVSMAKKGWNVTGIDQSEEMLRLARHRASQTKVKVDFINQDMRFIDFSSQFDIATCWFDSLNYLITNDDLQSAFNNISRALKPNGWFLFDMNTVYGLAVTWQKKSCAVEQETSDLLELHRTSYNYEKRLACLTITWFVKVDDRWEKFEEKHTERAFSIEEIEKCLEYAGFHIVDKLGRLDPFTPLQPNSSRVWFIARK
ncbi:MAG: class I SAM-dependent methyltransferase [Anaerolineaceae bacterium]|nr:class I SAM-dependent methyltransferase [Anaerolineaceae bacterium]